MNNISFGKDNLALLGWREWVSFPQWGVSYIKAKVDTGAQTSSLHTQDLMIYKENGISMVRFTVFPHQKNNGDSTTIESELVAFRKVRSSSGYLEKRPVVLADIIIAGQQFKTEITLTNRELMGFRMLIGRRALDKRFAVLTHKSYLGLKAPKAIRDLNREGDQKP